MERGRLVRSDGRALPAVCLCGVRESFARMRTRTVAQQSIHAAHTPAWQHASFAADEPSALHGRYGAWASCPRATDGGCDAEDCVSGEDAFTPGNFSGE